MVSTLSAYIELKVIFSSDERMLKEKASQSHKLVDGPQRKGRRTNNPITFFLTGGICIDVEE